MANTFSQIYLHYVFAVKHREGIIQEAWREDLQRYMSGIVSNEGHKIVAIYCMPDHCHLLVGFTPSGAVSDLARSVKANSSRWINENGHVNGRFEWQSGYGVFSHGHKELDIVIVYINSQPTHHLKQNFQMEYKGILGKVGIVYEEKYLFEWIEK